MMDWIRHPTWNKTSISIIWKVVLNSLPLIRDGITWKIHSGSSVRIGFDPWIGSGNSHRLPQELIMIINNVDITNIDHILDPENTTLFQQAWKSAHHLNIPQIWHHRWETYLSALVESHIRITEGDDELVWAQAKHGIYSPKEGYIYIYVDHHPPISEN